MCLLSNMKSSFAKKKAQISDVAPSRSACPPAVLSAPVLLTGQNVELEVGVD